MEICDVTYLHPVSEPIPKADSKCIGKFKNGATIFPHCLLIVEKIDKEENEKARIKTRKSQHNPWKKGEPQRRIVPRRWITSQVGSQTICYLLQYDLKLCKRVFLSLKINLSRNLLRKNRIGQRLNKLFHEGNKGVGKIERQRPYSTELISILH